MSLTGLRGWSRDLCPTAPLAVRCAGTLRDRPEKGHSGPDRLDGTRRCTGSTSRRVAVGLEEGRRTGPAVPGRDPHGGAQSGRPEAGRQQGGIQCPSWGPRAGYLVARARRNRWECYRHNPLGPGWVLTNLLTNSRARSRTSPPAIWTDARTEHSQPAPISTHRTHLRRLRA